MTAGVAAGRVGFGSFNDALEAINADQPVKWNDRSPPKAEDGGVRSRAYRSEVDLL